LPPSICVPAYWPVRANAEQRVGRYLQQAAIKAKARARAQGQLAKEKAAPVPVDEGTPEFQEQLTAAFQEKKKSAELDRRREQGRAEYEKELAAMKELEAAGAGR
jgi:hypothetical protein